jgi:glycosyltransferase involved in cell wall biosynthesis
MGQCLRSGGGLFYDGYAEFRETLELLLSRPDMRRILGAQGLAYVEREYSWDVVDAKVEGLLASLAGPRGAS